MWSIKMTICKTCGGTDYYPNRTCKACAKARTKQWRLDHKEYAAEWYKNWAAKNVDRATKQSDCYGAQEGVTHYDSTERYPRSVLRFSTDKQQSTLHPTQKPVALCEYLIRTYTNEGETVLDNTMGSGTTGVACVNTGRDFIGIERDDKYFEIAQNRIIEAMGLA
jgi:DNA modification methylase